MNSINLLELVQQLISFHSITPGDGGSIDYLNEYLTRLGFKCSILTFNNIKNLYAEIGDNFPSICFVGHLDVVETGPLESWKYNPFSATIENQQIYGRGIVDMKAAIACFIWAAKTFVQTHPLMGSIKILLSADEETNSLYGAAPLTQFLQNSPRYTDLIILGEPTSEKVVVDTIKLGRRGSINFEVTIKGQQGHVAYPEKSINPLNQLPMILNHLMHTKLDQGNNYFLPSNLVITAINTSNEAENIIPQEVKFRFNIRFNNLHTEISLIKLVNDLIKRYIHPCTYSLVTKTSALPFYRNDPFYTTLVSNVIYELTGNLPSLSTSGGTSDARFYHILAPVIEIGLLNSTAHKINEMSDIKDIFKLAEIYLRILQTFFKTLH